VSKVLDKRSDPIEIRAFYHQKYAVWSAVTYALPCYWQFRDHLLRSGFTIFPGEFDCFGARHPLVDIAGKMGSFYWAFEYKSETDSISRGVEQVKSYSDWFDYVVLVSERTLNHSKSELFWDLKGMGAGVWNYFPDSDKCIKQVNPSLQKPDRGNRRSVGLRFRALDGGKRKRWSRAFPRADLGQSDIRAFF
jgi:hypothetical protein